MKKRPSEYTNPDELKVLMKNAERLGREEVWWEAFQRLTELLGMKELQEEDNPEPLHSEFFQTLVAYEQLLTKKNGRTTVASRTRQKLKNKGLIQCLEDWALDSSPTEGFELLIKNNLAKLTGEYLIIKYPKHFSKEAIESAKMRLADSGVTLPNTSE